MDVERWLAELQPDVINAWLRFAALEPEWFARPACHAGPGETNRQLTDGAEAAQTMAARLFGK